MQFRFAHLVFAVALVADPMAAQQPVTNEPSDLQVTLRSTNGSNRFQIGDPIELEAVFSSTTPGKYLEPCGLFFKPNIRPYFGLPLCRFRTRWSFDIKPNKGWTMLDIEIGGPTFKVPDRDISPKETPYSYALTDRYRFDEPGEYRVTFTVAVGLDDDSTQRRPNDSHGANPHFVTVTREIVLQIIPKSFHEKAG